MPDKNSRPWHVFCFAVFPVLFLFVRNYGGIDFSEVGLPLIFILGFTAVILSFLRLILQDWRRAGLIVSLFLILFFSYGHIFQAVEGLKIAGVVVGRHRYMLFAWPFIFLVFTIIFACLKSENILNQLTRGLNLMGVILVLFSGVMVVKILPHLAHKPGAIAAKPVVGPAAALPPGKKSLPDIYYIILDSHTRSDVLKTDCHYDNTGFIRYLQQKGFYVAAKSRSNYSWTALSLASSLNMRYLTDDDNLGQLRRGNKAVEVLRAIGYKIIALPYVSRGSDYYGIDADEVYSYGPSRAFLPLLVNTTFLSPFSFFCSFNFIYDYQRKCILYQFAKLNEIPLKSEPTFTFVHIFIPHPPYIFNREGKPFKFTLSDLKRLKAMPGDLWHQREAELYVEQLEFAEQKAKEAIDKILAGSSTPPIIILQGDHGPFLGFAARQITDALLRQRMSILNAYYVPQAVKCGLYDEITPVNSFRLLFDRFFHQPYDLLPDKSYYTPQSSLRSVTYAPVEKINGPQPAKKK